MRVYFTIALTWLCGCLQAQTLGGQTAFNFLRLPASAGVTGMGGMNISLPTQDLAMVKENPALLQPVMHAQLNTSFQKSLDDTHAYFLASALRLEKWDMQVAAALHYIDYGQLPQTDAGGTELGYFRPRDWTAQLSASKSYLTKWQFGITLKFMQSSYGQYAANGIAADAGILFKDSARGWQISAVAKNMGSMLKNYTASAAEDLPFDLQLGATYRLPKAPFAFSLTTHHLHRLALGYNDIQFNNQQGWPNTGRGKWSADNLLRHMVLATHIYIGDYIRGDIGFNYLRRKELEVGPSGNGLTGFSFGFAFENKRFQLRYALSQFQPGKTLHHFGLALAMDKLNAL